MAGESIIRKALKARVEQYGGEVRAVSWLGRRHAPDVLCLFSNGFGKHPLFSHPKAHIFVETKRPKKDATEGQAREHERMRAAGCVVLVISTLKQLDDWLPPL
jgi:hypothetical protein